ETRFRPEPLSDDLLVRRVRPARRTCDVEPNVLQMGRADAVPMPAHELARIDSRPGEMAAVRAERDLLRVETLEEPLVLVLGLDPCAHMLVQTRGHAVLARLLADELERASDLREAGLVGVGADGRLRDARRLR